MPTPILTARMRQSMPEFGLLRAAQLCSSLATDSGLHQQVALDAEYLVVEILRYGCVAGQVGALRDGGDNMSLTADSLLKTDITQLRQEMHYMSSYTSASIEWHQPICILCCYLMTGNVGH